MGWTFLFPLMVKYKNVSDFLKYRIEIKKKKSRDFRSSIILLLLPKSKKLCVRTELISIDEFLLFPEMIREYNFLDNTRENEIDRCAWW